MNKIATALALVLLATPVGVAATELNERTTAVENHTTYVQIIVDEERDHAAEYAAIAGLVKCNPTGPLAQAVLWFNDQLLFRAPGPKAPDTKCVIENDTHVYAVEEGSPDPRGNPGLTPTGDVFEFTDPNGVDWRVVEYAYYSVVATHKQAAAVAAGPLEVNVDSEAQARFIEHLTWVVELGPSTVDPTLADFYNFVVLLNLTKMDKVREDAVRHDGSAGNVEGGNSHDASSEDEQHSFPHDHDAARVHLYTGAPPQPSSWSGPGEGASVRVGGTTVAKAFEPPA